MRLPDAPTIAMIALAAVIAVGLLWAGINKSAMALHDHGYYGADNNWHRY
jgi:hypothetical protein